MFFRRQHIPEFSDRRKLVSYWDEKSYVKASVKKQFQTKIISKVNFSILFQERERVEKLCSFMTFFL